MDRAAAFQWIERNILPLDNEKKTQLSSYVNLLEKWNQTHNLIGKSTRAAIWERHILDSAQLYPFVTHAAKGAVVDVGSGAGLPGLVLAILGIADMHLVESNHKKVIFLREMSHKLNVPVRIHATRIEALPPFPASVITSRATADLAQLIEYSIPFLSDKTLCIFPKGANYLAEIMQAKKQWEWSEKNYPSQVNHGIKKEQGMILSLSKIRPLQQKGNRYGT